MARGEGVGATKFWTLAYADDLACIAKSEGGMNSMLKRLKKCITQRELTQNVEKRTMEVAGKTNRN